MPFLTKLLAVALTVVALAGCGGSDSATPAAQPDDVAADVADSSPGIRLVSADDGAAVQANPPEGLVILDVRTPEEFADGHLEGATTIDFYQADFADQLANLDPDVPYLLYCQSGNRSGQAAAIMEGLGFSDVADIDGGIASWTAAGLPTATQ